MTLENCRVVLVRPHYPGNLGATARVMRNMGLSRLVLVAPLADPADHEARRLSAHGEEILDRARVVTELGEAVADCVFVAGTSARVGGPGRRQSVGAPDEILPHLAAACAEQPVALVFGPEPSGLSDVDVTRCHYLIHIPADATYPALNLAQAVTVCLYELRRTWLRQTGPPSLPSPAAGGGKPLSPSPAAGGGLGWGEPPAPFDLQGRMFADLRRALEEIHFLWGESADSLMHAVRHLIGRAQPTATEVGILFGLARQIRWYVEHHPRRPEG
jgi:tRNA/rRNA methyltransferase